MSCDFSVVIPLYNKERDVERAIRSVLAQTLLPREIVVVDDGSTDGSAQVVERIASPLITLIRQPNGGVCAARNRAISACSGTYIALLDADDGWKPRFLEHIAALIDQYPGCGIYCTAFDIVSNNGSHPAPTPSERGIVKNFFSESAHRYIAIPSASVIPRRVLDQVGGFPLGMKLGEDQYVWFKIARCYPVCFTPERLADYSREAANRSTAIYTPENTRYSFEELYNPTAPADQNEFVARVALARALAISAKGGTEEAARAAHFFAYTKTYRRTLRKIRVLNALPVAWRAPLLRFYDRMAWLIAKKGL